MSPEIEFANSLDCNSPYELIDGKDLVERDIFCFARSKGDPSEMRTLNQSLARGIRLKTKDGHIILTGDFTGRKDSLYYRHFIYYKFNKVLPYDPKQQSKYEEESDI